MGIHNVISAKNGSLPFSMDAMKGNGNMGANSGTATWNMTGTGGYSWITMTLAYMEFAFVVDKFNMTQDSDSAANLPLSQTVIPGLLCPSNSSQAKQRNTLKNNEGNGTIANAGGTDYTGSLGHVWAGWKDCGAIPDFPDTQATSRFTRGSAGTPWVNQQYLNEQPNCNGVFQFAGGNTLSEIRDGTSKTIAVYEDMHWRGGNGPQANFDYGYNDVAGWVSPLAAVGTMRNPLNNTNPAWQNGAGDRRCSGWSSFHPGGAHAMRADGSVSFYSNDISDVIRYSLATSRGGEAVGGD